LECILNQVDPQFETTQGLNYRLSILLCQDGFSFLVIHAVTHQVLKLESYKFAFSDFQHSELGGWPVNGEGYFELVKSAECVKQSYQRIDIAVASFKITIAPPDFIRAENVLSMMSVAHSLSTAEEIFTETVFEKGPVTAVVIPGYIKDYCDVLFPGSNLHSAPTIFVKGVIQKHSKSIARQVFLNINRGYFEVVVIQGSRILYLNAFKYSSPSDVLYYVIFVLEQLGFVPSEETVTLMGDISENETIYGQLKMYCGSISYEDNPAGLEYGEAFSGVSLHKYFTLLNLSLCE
jgi:hypothetical protein